MNRRETALAGVYLLEPRVFSDARGRFLESWNARRYTEAGVPGPFVQDNVSVSSRGVLRGLHLQAARPQGKLVSVLEGEVFDVAVDLRPGPGHGSWLGCKLSAENGHQLYIPPGCAHGFVVLSERAVFAYKCTDYYDPASELTIRWDDPDLAIQWPVSDPVLSEKDREGITFAEVSRRLHAASG